MPFLSIIITTNGNESLYYSVCALREQMRPMDELVVVANGRLPEARRIILGTIGNRPNVWYVENEADSSTQAWKSGWLRARGVRLLFLNETDLIARGALDVIREKAEEFNEFPLLFLSKGLDGKTKTDILVPYNKITKADHIEEIVMAQGELVLVNHVAVLRGVPIV